ncbi:MAG: hypothetical protein A2X36_09630 [Elusimicrobia bacterium GWA2_69_24]|nr:MAG: hypothetical protein A2X36_09630 [Elusimicrobia bacterium GWA2_69_24]HBL17983.1 hypothetical protein [Elusimicrobiota bacterium]
MLRLGPIIAVLVLASGAGAWLALRSYRGTPPAEAAPAETSADPHDSRPAPWLRPACERALATMTPAETKAHRRFAPDCVNDPVGTLLYLNQQLSRPYNKVPTAEAASLEVIPLFEGLSFGEDPKATVRLLVTLRNAAGDPVSADGRLDAQVEPAGMGATWDRRPAEVSAGQFELTDDPAQPALRAEAGRLTFSLAAVRGRKLFARVRFNDSVTSEGILDFNEVLPGR